MTKATFAAATLAYGPNRTDVAVPLGTTVGSLLASFRLDITNPEISVALPDGQPADPSATIGGDLPSGVLLNVVDAAATSQALAQAARLEANAGFAGRASRIVNLVFAAGLGVVAMGPLFWSWLNIGQPFRIAAGVLLLAAVAILSWRTGLASRITGSLAGPGVVGLAATSVISAQLPQAGAISLALATTTAALVALINWLRDHQHTVAAAAVWGTIAAIGLIAVTTGAGPAQVGSALLVVGVAAVVIAPQYALQIPESQVLDLPLLTTSAVNVRIVTPPEPTRITRRRVRHTVAHAYSVTDAVTLGGAAVAAVGAALLAPSLGISTEGLGAGVALATAAIGLALIPRDHRSKVVRLAPRMAAATIVATTALALTALTNPAFVAAGTIALSAAVVLSTTFASQRHTSALLGRAADVFQGLALLLLLPAAFVATGAFQLIWQAAS